MIGNHRSRWLLRKGYSLGLTVPKALAWKANMASMASAQANHSSFISLKVELDGNSLGNRLDVRSVGLSRAVAAEWRLLKV